MTPGSATRALFGGPIRTPTYDRMAENGLRYNRFHVTAMCSPTRAALLTGRNHHAVGMGGIPEFSGGLPGYSAMLPRDAAPFPKILKENGYSTAGIAGAAAGALIGKFARHKVESGLSSKLGDALPPGTAGLIAIYDRTKTDTVDKALVSAVKKSVA